MTKIAFIGLGNMGTPMAGNLVKAGYAVTGFDLVPANLEKAASRGVTAARSAEAAAEGADVVITMLPAGKDTVAVYEGTNVLTAADSGAVFVDCSTIDVASARRAHELAGIAGRLSLDCPVSGGVGGAEAATLTLMAGGSASAFEKARPVLEKMSRKVVHCGDAGAGQAAKICNNMLLGILMAGTSEALALGVANGLDPKVLSDIIAKSSGRNWATELYNPWPGVMDHAPASKGYAGGFGVDLMLKDLGLAAEFALSTRSSIPLGELARNLYSLHSAAGTGKLDFSSIVKLYTDKAA